MSTKSKAPESKAPSTPSSKQPKPVRVVRSANTPTIFAEGVSQLVIGFPMSRVVFFKSVDHDSSTDPPTEVHQVAYELIIPTPALAETCMAILQHMTGAKGLLTSSRNDWTQRVDAVMQKIETTPNTTPATDS